jgi:hypothetical protein
MSTLKKSASRQEIYSGRAVAADGHSLDLKVYYLGGLAYELHCSSRPKHLFDASASIGDDPITNEFVRAYRLDDVRLARVPSLEQGRLY